MNDIANNNLAPGKTAEVDSESLRRRAKERLAPGASYAGDVTPEEAWQMLGADEAAQLVDVRTAAEWNFVGRPDLKSLGKKPVLVSWQFYPDMAPNKEFMADLSDAGAVPSAPLVFLCRSGLRSASAAEYCTAEGYAECYNIIEGFEGDLDDDKHRGGIAGWKMRALPWLQG
jgi:rhodanese-related sulfurtransferase